MRDWEKVRDSNDIMVIFDEIKAAGPAFHLMPHYALTYAICLARVGRRAEGQDQLDKFLYMSGEHDNKEFSDKIRYIFEGTHPSFEG